MDQLKEEESNFLTEDKELKEKITNLDSISSKLETLVNFEEKLAYLKEKDFPHDSIKKVKN